MQPALLRRFPFFVFLALVLTTSAYAGKRYVEAVETLNLTEDLSRRLSLTCKHQLEAPLANAFDVTRLSNVNLANEPTEGSVWFKPLRDVIVPFIRGAQKRFGYLVEAAREKMLLNSRALKSELFSVDPFAAGGDRYTSRNAYPVVIIGAGVSEQTLQNRLTALGIKGPRATNSITFEMSPFVSANFTTKGDAGSLNSTNRASDFADANLPGKGNLNYFPEGVLQTSDFYEKYPTWKQIAGIATFNRSISDAPVAFETKVVEVYDRRIQELPPELAARVPKDAPPYVVIVQDLTKSGASEFAVVFTDHVITTLGVGTGGIPKDIQSNIQIANRNTVFPSLQGIAQKTIQTYDEILEEINTGRLSFGDFVGKRVSVWGYGDSGKTTIEWLLRRGPANSYGTDSAQVGDVKTIFWFIGDTTLKDCEDYITKNRVRYAAIADGIKSGRVVPITGRVQGARDPKFAFGVETRYAVPAGKNLVLSGSEIVISCLGYDKAETFSMFRKLAERLAELANRNMLSIFDDVLPVQLGNGAKSERIVGNLLFGKRGTRQGCDQSIAVLGPTLPAAAESELSGVAANVVSIFANAPRIAQYITDFYTNILVPNASKWCEEARLRDPVVESERQVRAYLTRIGRLGRNLRRRIVSADGTRTDLVGTIPRTRDGVNPEFGVNPVFAAADDPELYFLFRLTTQLTESARTLAVDVPLRDMRLDVYPADDRTIGLNLRVRNGESKLDAPNAFLELLERDREFGDGIRQLFVDHTAFSISGISLDWKNGKPVVDRSQIRFEFP